MNLNTYFKRPTIRITGIAILASLSVIFQILPPIYLTPWFMRIDFVAIPWILCWIFFGLKAAIFCLLISIPLVGFLGPFAGGIVGIIMKSIASIWMFLIPAVFSYKIDGIEKFLRNKKLYLISSIIAIILRDIITVIFNLYFAIPVFFGMTTEQVIEFFTNPKFQSFIGHLFGLIGFGAYFIEITFWNTIQSIIDLYVSYFIGIIILRRLVY